MNELTTECKKGFIYGFCKSMFWEYIENGYDQNKIKPFNDELIKESLTSFGIEFDEDDLKNIEMFDQEFHEYGNKRLEGA